MVYKHHASKEMSSRVRRHERYRSQTLFLASAVIAKRGAFRKSGGSDGQVDFGRRKDWGRQESLAFSQEPIAPPSSLVMTTTAERGLATAEPLAVVGPFMPLSGQVEFSV